MEKKDFNDGWQFVKQGAEKKSVCLPHDAMLEEKRFAEAESGSAGAFFPGGLYEYEKAFYAPYEWKQKHIEFQFEGIYKNSEIYINGKKAGGAVYGYIPFFVCADKFLNYDSENTIRVIVDNQNQPNSRWYTGSGIYRPVWLWIGEKSHINPEGIKISTLCFYPARIAVKTDYTGEPETEVSVEIMDTENKIVACGSGSDIELDIPDAQLWSDETPYLYSCCVTLHRNREIVDFSKVNFGIRKIEWSEKGLFVNGKETLLRGGCLHHDQGILGAATYQESEMRRISKLKRAGFNAVRSSHNPASNALLEACDKYGMYVIDETWDMWYSHKNKFDYACDFMEYYHDDIKSMVNRDFNHPSVIMYSIGNEVSEPATEAGMEIAKEMKDYLHRLDAGRAVTAGINLMIIYNTSKGKDNHVDENNRDKNVNMDSTMFNQMAAKIGSGLNNSANSPEADEVTSPVLDVLDIAGYNYASGRYPLEKKAHPDRVIVGSETFPQDIVKNWRMVKEYPYLIGDFMWTCWDYLGEVGIGAWAYTSDGMGFEKPYPWLLGDVGVFDILGNPNGELFQAQAVWGLLKNPAIAVCPVSHSSIEPTKAVWRGTNALPSWSWQGCEGREAEVEVYTDAAKVELYLNDEYVGTKEVNDCKVTFCVKYAAGTLKAIAYDTIDNKIGESELRSASGKIRIRVTPETNSVSVGHIMYVAIELVGENGEVESNADELLNVFVEGGKLLGFGSANPRTEETYQSGRFSTYYGHALAVVKADKPENLKIRVSSERLDAVSSTIMVTEKE